MVAPTVTITSPSSFTVSDGAVVVKMDGAVINKLSGSVLDTLAAGSHTVRVEATNAFGISFWDVHAFRAKHLTTTFLVIESLHTTPSPTRCTRRTASHPGAGDRYNRYIR
jgi:hypothetical protein